MIFFINSEFWCQSAVCKKFAAKIHVYELLALLANKMTFCVSPSSIKHFSDFILSPNLTYKFEASSKLPCFLHFYAMVLVSYTLLAFYTGLLDSSSGSIFLTSSSWMGTLCWIQMSRAFSYCFKLTSKGTARSNLPASTSSFTRALIAALSPPLTISYYFSDYYCSGTYIEMSSVNPCFSANMFAFLIAPAFLYSLIAFSISPFLSK